MTIFLIFCFFYALVDAIHDYFVINNNSQGWHTADALIKTSVLGMIVYAFLFGDIIYYEPIDYFILIFIGLTIRWVFFDLFLNILRGKHPLYLGDSNFLDKLGVLNIMLKVLFLFLSIPMIMIFYNRM